MAFERRFSRGAVQERKKEFFGPDGHLTSFGIGQWLYGDVSYNSHRKNYLPVKEHLATCQGCLDAVEYRRRTDPGEKSKGVPVHDRE